MGNATSKTKKGKKNKSGDSDAKAEDTKVDEQKVADQQKVNDQQATAETDSAKTAEGGSGASGGSSGSGGGTERKKSPSQIVRDIQHDPTVGRYLKHVPLLSKLKDSDRDKVGGALELLEYKDESNVFEQGEDGHGFYVIKAGTVSITRTDPESKEKSELARLGAGDYFGETALLKNEKRGGTATCVGPCEIFFLDKDKFFALFGEDKINVQFAVRRVAISAEQMLAGLVREDIKKPAQAVIDKSDAQSELIMNSIESNVLFQNLTREQQTKLLAEFYQTEIKEGKSVVTQGEMGLHFYIVETGAFDVVVTDPDTKVAKKVASRGPGQCFGELALMYNAPRAATVTATADSLVWMLDRFTFRRIAQDVGANALNRYLQFMQSVDLLSPLAEYEREKIAEALEEVHFRRGTAIFKQGDEGDAMYIIEEGEVRVTKLDDGKEEEEVNRIRKGDYFGERALLNNEPRAATVTAVLDTYCLKLDRNAFSLLLGPLEEIMKKKISSYDAKEEEEKIQPLSTEYKFTDLETVGTLGKGSFGFVTLVRHKPSGGAFALKAVSKAQIVETSQQGHIMSEKRVMQTLQHPFLIRLYATYKDRNLLYFLLEPSLGGELFTVLRKHRLFSEPTARFYAGCVIMAFEYMHSREYIYRDLKPENLLLDAEGYIKVTDFGFAKKIKNKTWTLCGTPEYLAPEIVGGKGHGKGVDWWTVGVLIYEMLASYTPFYHDDHMKMYAKIAKGKYQFPSHFTKEAKGLVRDLLQVQPTKRLGVVRGGATLIKESPFFKGFDWQKLYEKKLKGPIQPKIKNPFDLANFDESDDRQHHVKPYNDDGSNWDADF